MCKILSLYLTKFFRYIWQHFPGHLCEVSSIQSLATMTPEQQMSAVAEAIVSMGHNVNQFYKDVKHRYIYICVR